jgi:hypothetical protein
MLRTYLPLLIKVCLHVSTIIGLNPNSFIHPRGLMSGYHHIGGWAMKTCLECVAVACYIQMEVWGLGSYLCVFCKLVEVV